jgi:DNA-binding MarR family transcriptional regulator
LIGSITEANEFSAAALDICRCTCNHGVMNKISPIKEMSSDCLAVRVRLLARSLSAIYDQAVASHGVTIAQVNLLTALGGIGPCAPRKLGEVLQLERSTVSRNLDLLIEKGLVEAVSTDWKGIAEVALSKAGLKKIEAVLPDWRAAQKQAHELLGSDGVQAVYDASATIWTAPI